nr:tetratricopeptide repeat protein [Sporolactobacillus mangiferae]
MEKVGQKTNEFCYESFAQSIFVIYFLVLYFYLDYSFSKREKLSSFRINPAKVGDLMMDFAAESRIKEARTLIEQGSIGQGLRKFNTLMASFPQDSRVQLHYALALDQQGMEVEAIPHYQKALQLGMRTEDVRVALICLASSYRNVGRHDAALETIERAVEKYKNDAVVQCFYSLILLDNGQSARAVGMLGHLLLQEAAPQKFTGFEQALHNKFDDFKIHRLPSE